MATYDRAQLEAALRKADAAGNTADASALAKALRGLGPAAPAPAGPATPDSVQAGPAARQRGMPVQAGPQATPIPPAPQPLGAGVNPPEPEPSGFGKSALMGALGGVQSASTFLHESMLHSMRKEMDATVAREKKGLPIHPMWSRESIRKRYARATGDQKWVDEVLSGYMDDLDYQTAEWKSGERWARVKQVIGSAAGSTVPMLLTGPAAPVTAYAMAGGQVLQELKDIRGLTADQKLQIAQVSGVPMAALERLGLGAIVGKGLIKGAAGEAVTETLAEMGVITIGAMHGREYEAIELLERGGEAALGGAGAGPTVRAGVEVARLPGKALGKGGEKIADIVEGWEYGVDADKMLSDERVARAYSGKLESLGEARMGDMGQAWNIFKTLGKEAKQTITKTLDILVGQGAIDTEERKALDAITAKSSMQSLVLDASDLQFIESLPLRPEVKKTLMEAYRDMNTTVHLGMDKNTRGPAQEWFRRYGGMIGIAAGAKVGKPGIGLVIGGALEGVGRGIDTVTKARIPRVLKGRESRQRLIRKAGLEVTNPLKTLEGLREKVRQGQRLATDDRQAAIETGHQMRRNRRRLNDPGLGGFDRLIFSGKPSSDISGTGLLPLEVDKGMAELFMRQDITGEQWRLFYEAPNVLETGRVGLGIMDMLNGLANEGLLTRTPEADPATLASQGVPTANIPNPIAYSAVVRSAEVARDQAYKMIEEAGLPPEVQQSLAGITGKIVALKDRSQKLAVLTTVLQGLQGAERDTAQRILQPLTEFGKMSKSTAKKIEDAVKE